jgi:hemerythrin-like domain-containing protein
MKRSSALKSLARDHHLTLVLARRAQRSAVMTSDDQLQLLADLKTAFIELLEPHFKIEEQKLFPAILSKGESAGVGRALADHQTLRDYMKRIRRGDTECLEMFGELLASHVRFEDRELLGQAEMLYTDSELAALMAE